MTMKKYRNNRGFTLGEMLITVAITVILAAVSIINVVPYMWNLRLKDADQAAHEIYLAAQYHLNAAASTGALSTYTRDDLGQEDELYKKSYYESAGAQNIYDIVVSPDTKKPAILDEILPYGSVDETMRSGGSYIITYDYDSATVLGVFYSYAGRSYGYTFTSNVLKSQKEALKKAMASEKGSISSYAAKSVRRHFPDGKAGKTIGFYGGKDSDSAAVKSDAPGLNIDNGDTLSALISLNKEQENLLRGDQYYLQLKVYGTTSKETEVKDLKLSDLTQQSISSHTYSYILDAYQDKDGKESKRFGTQFKKLYAGENITVSVSLVKEGNNKTYTSVSKVSNAVKTNSLFASLKNGNTAGISSIRHLENLGQYNYQKLTVSGASQVTDLSFTKYKENLMALVGASNENANAITYEPVNLATSLTYDGSYTSKNTTLQHTLSDITTDVRGDGGVFGTLSGKESQLKVTGLEVMNINVKAGGHAGALLGQAKDSASFTAENVLVWDKTAEEAVQSTGDGTDAGGLIGHGSGSVKITNSAASIYVQGKNNAGGLAGYAKTLSVNDSYSSGHTYQGKYVTQTEVSTENGNQRYNIIAGNGYAGGLAGYADAVNSLSNSYTTASIYSDTAANSAVYVGYIKDNKTYDRRNCYAVTSLNDKMVTEPSDYKGSGSVNTKYVNDKTLLESESEVVYPYTTVYVLDSTGLKDAPWFLKTHVGDWQSSDQHKPIVSFNNDEILQFKASLPNVSSSDTVEIQFFYQGSFGLADVSQPFTIAFRFKDGKIVAENQWTERTDWNWKTDLCNAETVDNVTNYTINIDDITYYKYGHSGNFRNVISSESGKSPGYDVTARVVVNGTPVSDPIYTNSSFGNKTNASTAVISCGRHLQNMSSDVAGRWNPIFQNASLTADIHWNTDSNTFFERVRKLRANSSDEVTSVYLFDGREIKDKKFYPITGHKMFSGSDTSFFGKGHTIYDISFDTANSNAGLFETMQGLLNVSDLTIENGVIQASGVKHAGILAGFVNNQTTISHCFVTGEKSMVRIGTSGDAGGLIGYFLGKEINNSGASAYVQGGNAGGLVGDFISGSITRSFSGGRTASGSYLQDAKNKRYYNVEGYENAGGLAGKTNSVISYCYSTSSVYAGNDEPIAAQWGYSKGGGNAGGLIGYTTLKNALKYCYATGMVIGPKGSSGALIGNLDRGDGFDSSTKYNYYLEGINVDPSDLEELPAVGNKSADDVKDHMSSVNYYSSDTDPIAKKEDPSVKYYTYSYDPGLTSPYPFISWTKQPGDISVHYGGWQLPINKSAYCKITLQNADSTEIVKAIVPYGSDWSEQFQKYTEAAQKEFVDGKPFIGWVDQNGNAVTESNFTSVISNITVTAKYGASVSFFYQNPETGERVLIRNQVVNQDGSVNVPGYLSFASYVFDGWFAGNSSSDKAQVKNGKIEQPLADQYCAKYKKQATYTYKVEFCYEDSNGSPGQKIESLQTRIYERGIDNYESFNQVISLSNLTVKNSSLHKVAVYDADTGKIIQDNVLDDKSNSFKITGYAQNVTYYVLYTSNPIQYTVTHVFKNAWNPNYSATISNGTLNNGESLVYSSAYDAELTENKTGFAGGMTSATILDLGSAANGWELDGSISQKRLGDEKVTVTVNYRRKNYTVKYDSAGGSYISPQNVAYGAPVQLPDSTTAHRTGYTLTGWTIAYGNTIMQKAPGESFDMPAEDVQVMAQWTQAATADITVQFWQQKPFTKDRYTTDDYDYVGAYTIKDQKIGDNVTLWQGSALRDAKNNGDVKSDFEHFHYSGVTTRQNADIEPYEEISVAVSADGSNTINLYYDRDTINIVFHYLSYYGSYYNWYSGSYYNWYSEINKTTWKGLYGEEFASRKFTWDGNYSWYESAESEEYSVDDPWSQHSVTLYSPGLPRLTFITYFHVEENARDKNDPNTMNLYGIQQASGYYKIKHYVQKLDGNADDYQSGYESKNSTDGGNGGNFTFSNKYPNGFELYGYRYEKSPHIYRCQEGESVDYNGNLYVYYKRKDIPITLWNVAVGENDGNQASHMNEKYESSYQKIQSDLDNLELKKPDRLTGEEFAGWYLDPSFEHKFMGSKSEKLTGPLQLFAKWEPAQYQVNFYNGDSSDSIAQCQLQSGDVLYSSAGTVNYFPSVEVPEGYELRWYYVDRDGKEQPYVMDRQLQKDLIRSDRKDENGRYLIELRARFVPVGEVHLTYQLVDRVGNIISIDGKSMFKTDETYAIGAAYHINPPEVDGYIYLSGADGVAAAGTEREPVKLVYDAREGSWRHLRKYYVSYKDIDNPRKKDIEVEIPVEDSPALSMKDEVTESAPVLDGYTFVESAIVKSGANRAERSSSSQVTLKKIDGEGQTAAFWYQAVWNGTLTQNMAVYDGQEHGVTFVPSVMPAIGEHTAVYKYTYTRTLADQKESVVQYVWSDKTGSHTSGQAPVNAGIYTVTVEVLLYDADTVSAPGSGSYLTVYRHVFDGSEELNISPAKVVITSGSHDWTYDGKAHSLNEWSVTVNGVSVKAEESPFTVSFLPTSSLIEPGVIDNTFTYAVKNDYLASNYHVSLVSGKLTVGWQYRVQYVLSLPDCVYEEKSDEEKRKAAEDGTDVKPIQILMYENMVTTPAQVLTFNDSSAEAAELDGLKRSDSGVQTIRYTDQNPVVTYVYTLNLDGVQLSTEGDVHIVLDDKEENVQKVLKALKPFLKAAQTDDNTQEAQTADTYDAYQAVKSPDYRLVYRFTYTDSSNNTSVVMYQVDEGGSVSKDTLLSGTVPETAGTYQICGEILLQHRTKTTDEDGNVTETWNDSNILWQSSEAAEYTIGGNSES